MCIKIYNRNLDASWPEFNGGETTSDWRVTFSFVHTYNVYTYTHMYVCIYYARACDAKHLVTH